jgi:hypothetical protein
MMDRLRECGYETLAFAQSLQQDAALMQESVKGMQEEVDGAVEKIRVDQDRRNGRRLAISGDLDCSVNGKTGKLSLRDIARGGTRGDPIGIAAEVGDRLSLLFGSQAITGKVVAIRDGTFHIAFDPLDLLQSRALDAWVLSRSGGILPGAA